MSYLTGKGKKQYTTSYQTNNLKDVCNSGIMMLWNSRTHHLEDRISAESFQNICQLFIWPISIYKTKDLQLMKSSKTNFRTVTTK